MSKKRDRLDKREPWVMHSAQSNLPAPHCEAFVFERGLPGRSVYFKNSAIARAMETIGQVETPTIMVKNRTSAT